MKHYPAVSGRRRATVTSALYRHIFLAILLPVFTSPVSAVETVEFEVGDVVAETWTADDIRVTVGVEQDRFRASFFVGSARLKDPALTLTELELTCAALSVENNLALCADGVLTFQSPELGRQTSSAEAVYDLSSGRMSGQVDALSLAGGSLQILAVSDGDDWYTEVDGFDLRIDLLAKLAGRFRKLPPTDIDTPIDLDLTLRGNEKGLERAVGEIHIKGLTGSNEEGTFASDSLDIRLKGDVSGDRELSGHIDVTVPSGQFYLDPVFLDFGERSLSVSADYVLPADGKTARFDNVTVAHTDTLAASGRASVSLVEPKGVKELDLDITSGQFPNLYVSFFQPYLAGTAVDELETAGRVSGRVTMRDHETKSLNVTLEEIHVADEGDRFALYEVNGTYCHRYGEVEPCESVLTWDAGTLYGVPLDAASVSWTGANDNYLVKTPVTLPFLDSGLVVNTLEVTGYGTKTESYRFDAELESVDLRELTTAMGWPYQFSGTLAGKLPDLTYEEGVVTVEGSMTSRVFDGDLTVSNLRLSQPFGDLPRFAADIEFSNLDLKLVTDAFSFGAITGRLDGHINGLELLKWSPVAFDLNLYSTPGDKTRRRISQRAIENLSDIGGTGAVAAALSTGFLKVFEDFSYDRLGLSCRLENDICIMDGVAPRDSGYFIVKGKGLPRIDVVGSGRRVGWTDLLTRIKRVLEQTEAVVE